MHRFRCTARAKHNDFAVGHVHVADIKQMREPVIVGVIAKQSAIFATNDGVHVSDFLSSIGKLVAQIHHGFFVRHRHVQPRKIAFTNESGDVVGLNFVQTVFIIAQHLMNARRVAVAELSTKQSVYGFRLRGSHLYSFIERAAARREFHHWSAALRFATCPHGSRKNPRGRQNTYRPSAIERIWPTIYADTSA